MLHNLTIFHIKEIKCINFFHFYSSAIRSVFMIIPINMNRRLKLTGFYTFWRTHMRTGDRKGVESIIVA